MGITIQKIVIGSVLGVSSLWMTQTASASELKKCSTAPIVVTLKNDGKVSYYAQDCAKAWNTQDIRLDFYYTRDIPEWAFKKAATHFLEKNISGFSSKSPLNQITALYRPVKSGDLYSIGYQMQNQKLDLVLNNKPLGSITDPHANDYFKIWFGAAPFNAKLKQQLLN
jgi:hypothetical protein